MAIAALGTLASNINTTDPQTFSHTLAAGANRVVFVALAWEGSFTVNGVTYGGVAMALATDGAQTATGDVGTGTTAQHNRIFVLKEADLPADGSNTVSIDKSGTGSISAVCHSYSGVDQASFPDVAVATNAASDQVQDVTISVPATSCVAFWSVGHGNTGTYTSHECPNGVAATELFDGVPASAVHAVAHKLPIGSTGSMVCESTASTATTNRHVICAVVMSEAATAVTVSGAVTTSAPAVSGSLTTGAVDPPSFVQVASGANGGNVTIAETPSATYLLVVAVCRSAAVGAGTTCTFNGVTMNVANNANDWAQLFYLFNPPDVTGAVSASGASVSLVIAAQYRDVASFDSGGQGSVLSHSVNPSRRALAAFAMSYGGGGATPLATTEERLDAGGDYYGDAIRTSGGTFSVGVSTGADPDSAYALFLGLADPSGETDVSGAVSSSSPSTSGALQTPKNLTGAVASASPATSGVVSTPKNVTGAVASAAPSTAGTFQVVATVTGAVTSAAPSTAGAIDTPKNLTGTVASASPTTSGSVQLPNDVSGAVTSGAPSTAGALSLPSNVSGAVSSSAPATTGTFELVATISGAVTSSAPSTVGAVSTPKQLSGAVASSAPATTGAFELVAAISGSVSSGSPATSGSVQVTATLSGAVTSSSPATTGNISVVDEVLISGAVTSTAPTTSGSITTAAGVSGAVASGAPSTSGTLAVIAAISGAVASAAAAVSGSIETPKGVAGAVSTGAPFTSGAVQLPKDMSGAVTSSPPSTSGSITTSFVQVEISGAVSSAPPTAAGTIQTVTHISGTVTTSSPTTSGTLHETRFISGTVTTSSPSTSGALGLADLPTGETQAQVGEDPSAAVVAVDATVVVSGEDDTHVVVEIDGVTSVRIG